MRLAIVLLFSLALRAADCDGSFTLDAAHTTVQFNNQSKACANWQVSYFSSGFSAVSVQFESAPNGANANVPGTWVAFAGTLITGSNPGTSITSNTSTFSGSFPWVRVRLVSSTGTGQITGRMLGIQLTTAGIGFLASQSAFAFPFHLPVIGNYTLVDGGSGVAPTNAARNGAIFPQGFILTVPVAAAGDDLAVMFRTSTIVAPYVFEIAFAPNWGQTLGFPSAGICIGDSATGRWNQYSVRPSNNGELTYIQWASFTAAGVATNVASSVSSNSYIFFRIVDDGVNRVTTVSIDGDSYQPMATEASGTFVANTNRWGWCFNSPAGTHTYSMTVFHECLYAGSTIAPLGSQNCT